MDDVFSQREKLKKRSQLKLLNRLFNKWWVLSLFDYSPKYSYNIGVKHRGVSGSKTIRNSAIFEHI